MTPLWLQAPLPSQRASQQSLVVVSAQIVLVGGNEQAPTPVHVPPQVPVPAHSSAGSVPEGMAEQVPTCDATLQAMHRPAHDVSQQTPSTHEPEAHAEVEMQVVPSRSPTRNRWPLERTPFTTTHTR